MRTLILCFIWMMPLGYGWSQDQAGPRQKEAEQESCLIYEVKPGETLYSISRKFQVPMQEIRDTNPDVTTLLKAGTRLRIPVAESADTRSLFPENRKPLRYIRHEIRKKETLYSISRQYGVTQEDLFTANPGLTRLKKGDVIRIPQWSVPVDIDLETGMARPVSDSATTHWVQQGETLYSLSRKYGRSVEALLEENPHARELKAGMRLTIPAQRPSAPSTSEQEAEAVQKLPSAPEFPRQGKTEIQTPSGGITRHTVRAGETLYSIARHYGVSVERLRESNPGISGGLPAGTTLAIPEPDGAVVLHPPEDGEVKEGVQQHLVKEGETLYGLARQYNVSMTDLVKGNPVLETRSPRAGDTLLIFASGIEKEPVHGALPDPPGREEPVDCSGTDGYDGAPIHLTLLLPLMTDDNLELNGKSGSVKDEEMSGSHSGSGSLKGNNKIQFQGNSENFIHFYEGVLLAVDSLQEMGVRISLEVFDTGRKSSKVKNLVSSGKLDKASIIIGPVFPPEQKEVSDFVMGKGIPLVSPLSSSEEITTGNPWYFQVNPSREYIAQATASYVISTYENSNILVLQTASSDDQAGKSYKQLKEELAAWPQQGNTSVRLCDYRKEGYAGLKSMLVKERANVVVISSQNEAEVSVVVSNIKPLAEAFNLILIGTNRFPQFESIDPEYYHAGQLEYLTPFWPDPGQASTLRFTDKFRHYFRTEPNQFSMQGFDVAFFFSKALSVFGPRLVRCIPAISEEMIQGVYQFRPSETGGFTNHGLNVVKYTSDYQIVRKKSLVNSSLPQTIF